MNNRPVTILIVEDDDAHVEAIRRAFEQIEDSFTITSVRSLATYRLALSTCTPDVVLADLNLLDGKAFDLLANPPDTLPYPVLVMTSYGDEHLAVQVLKSGALDYVVKSPETFMGMPHIIKRTLREWQHIQDRKQAQDALRESEERYRMLVEQAADGIFIAAPDGKYISVNNAGCKMLGYQPEELLGKSLRDLVLPGDQKTAPLGLNAFSTGSSIITERRMIRKDGELRTVEISARVLPNGSTQSIVRDITARKLAEERLRLQSTALESAANAILITDRDGSIEWVNPAFSALTGYTAEEALSQKPRDLVKSGLHHQGFYQQIWDTILLGNVWRGEMINRRKDGRLYTEEQTITPLLNPNGQISHFIAIKQDITEQKKAQAELLESQQALILSLQRLRVLHHIELTITSQIDLCTMMTTILDQITQLGSMNAVALFTPHIDGNGFELSAHAGLPARTGEIVINQMQGECAREVFENRHPAFISNLKSSPLADCLGSHLKDQYCCCAVLPLVINEQVKGLLLLFSQQPIEFDSEWKDFLQSLAFQVAIALDRFSLFSSMEQANEKLFEAYEATLEGWSRALELRQRETAGHSQRVVELTLALARALNIPEVEIQHIRWGALLHDIGKMGLPDSIMQKPGPLDPEEWDLMRHHPEFAYRLLSGIPYLASSLDIPYNHHEKWDGSGYPRGLNGEAIPLSARLFAVVDVWDALNEDRPYREKWTPEAVRAYLIEQKGIHFDPHIVDIFLNVVLPQKEGNTHAAVENAKTSTVLFPGD
jgi:PAS domain S-box-containing protein/putative nucleotidyltransferase with HDIG domain